MNLEPLAVSESEGVLKKKMDGVCQNNTTTNFKELSVTKSGANRATK